MLNKVVIMTFHLHTTFIAEELYEMNAFTHLQSCNRTGTVQSVQSYSEAAVG